MASSERFLVPKKLPRHEMLLRAARQYKTIDASALETLFALMRVSGDLQAALQVHFNRYKISSGRFTVLASLEFGTLADDAGPCELADHLGVTSATMTGLLDGLERDGLIARIDHPEDRRRMKVLLTTAGKRYLDQVLPDHFRRTSALMANLSAGERRQLIQLLHKVVQQIPALRGT
jgi:DNA-binding MarR family transcriptional regulator